MRTLYINTKGVGTFLIGGGEGGASEGVSRSSLILVGIYLYGNHKKGLRR